MEKKVLLYQGQLYVVKIVYLHINIYYYNDFLAEHFEIKKICKFIKRKYNLLIFWQNVKSYFNYCGICMTLKLIGYKLNKDFLSLQVFID